MRQHHAVRRPAAGAGLVSMSLATTSSASGELALVVDVEDQRPARLVESQERLLLVVRQERRRAARRPAAARTAPAGLVRGQVDLDGEGVEPHEGARACVRRALSSLRRPPGSGSRTRRAAATRIGRSAGRGDGAERVEGGEIVDDGADGGEPEPVDAGDGVRLGPGSATKVSAKPGRTEPPCASITVAALRRSRLISRLVPTFRMRLPRMATASAIGAVGVAGVDPPVVDEQIDGRIGLALGPDDQAGDDRDSDDDGNQERREARSHGSGMLACRTAADPPPPARGSRPQMQPQIPPDAVDSLRQGALIEAIKLTRQKTGLGLKEAKDAVELYMAAHPSLGAQYREAVASRRGGLGWLAIVALIVAAVAAYFWLR